MKMSGLLQQAQKMQEQMQRMQEEAGKKTVEATAGGGMVKVVANGKQEIISITLDPETVKMNDIEMLQDLVKAGVNEALKAAHDLTSQELKKMTGGLGPLGSLFQGG